jgi:hypothetical protein
MVQVSGKRASKKLTDYAFKVGFCQENNLTILQAKLSIGDLFAPHPKESPNHLFCPSFAARADEFH